MKDEEDDDDIEASLTKELNSLQSNKDKVQLFTPIDLACECGKYSSYASGYSSRI